MNVLAIIPARGGSKGIPRKNLRLCAGRPLLIWSIRAAAASKWIFQNQGEGRPVVSTDDPEIAEIASATGEAVVVDRPPELATDEAMTDPVLIHAVKAVMGQRCLPDLVVLLQPTVPVRRPGLIDDCIDHLRASRADALLTVETPRHHFLWWEEGDYATGAGPVLSRWVTQCPRRPRRQDMTGRERMLEENGSVFVCRTELLLGTGSRLGIVMEAGRAVYRGRIAAFETEPAIDIDTEEDFAKAETELRARQQQEAVA